MIHDISDSSILTWDSARGMIILTQRQNTKTISKNIILPQDNIKQSHDQDNPNEDIGDNSSGQVMAMHGDSTVPEQCCQCPGIGTCNSWEMDECWQTAVAPVGYPLVDEMENEDDLGTPEVIAGPEQDPDEEEEVVQDKMGGDVGGSCDQHIVL
jgi:hypothetical protein